MKTQVIQELERVLSQLKKEGLETKVCKLWNSPEGNMIIVLPPKIQLTEKGLELLTPE